MRGLVLTRLVLSMKAAFGRDPLECFDLVGGTSTGGLLAVALSRGMSPMEGQRLYMRLKDEVFDRLFPPYDSEVLAELLKEEFTAEGMMSDIKRPM